MQHEQQVCGHEDFRSALPALCLSAFYLVATYALALLMAVGLLGVGFTTNAQQFAQMLLMLAHFGSGSYAMLLLFAQRKYMEAHAIVLVLDTAAVLAMAMFRYALRSP